MQTLVCFYISYQQKINNHLFNFLYSIYKLALNFARMSAALQIANYKVDEVPKDFQQVIKNFIFMRRHKKISVQKPNLDFNATDKEWYDPDKNTKRMNFFMTEQQENQEKLIQNKILLQRNLYPSNHKVNGNKNKKSSKVSNQEDSVQSKERDEKFQLIKTKVIKKVSSWTPNKQKQRIVQKMYCKYLLNSLHKSNLLYIQKNIPPDLSVLETIQDGDYLKQGERKEYPHYSNVIQPVDLPGVMHEKVRIIREPVRLEPREFFFSVEDNTVFKVKHVFMLLRLIFEESVKNCTMIREMNFRGDESLKPFNENHHFEKIASMIGLNFRTVKLLFDILNDHYDLEKELALGRSDDYKMNVSEELKVLLDKEIKDYFDKKRLEGTIEYSSFTPVDEYYLSLKDLRGIFLEVHAKAK